jgi:glutamate dehydrogenase (NAD(P)+)
MGHLDMKLSESSVAIEGFGKVGAPLAALMAETGARVVAISTSRGALYSPQGLDTQRLIELAQRIGSRVVDDYEEAERIDGAALLELPVDLLCPCALGHSLHEGNARQVVARIICPGANNPITAEAESVLFERGVLVVPDFAANCGGALGAPMHFALVDPERIIGFMDWHIGGRLAAILAEADQLGVMPKQVAEAMALRRLRRLQQTARHPAFSRRLFWAALALYGRGLLPGRVIKPLALGFFEKALADE